MRTLDITEQLGCVAMKFNAVYAVKTGALCAALAISLTSTVAVAQRGLPNRCVAQTIAMCNFNWAGQGYSSLLACTQDQVQFCPPEGGNGGGPIGFWVCSERNGTISCEFDT